MARDGWGYYVYSEQKNRVRIYHHMAYTYGEAASWLKNNVGEGIDAWYGGGYPDHPTHYDVTGPIDESKLNYPPFRYESDE